MPNVDLTPFGFTPTESVVYAALLQLGPSTGYGVSRATRLARANAYGALAGLVTRGAAHRTPGRPVQYRPTDPQALLAHLAAQPGDALDRLSRAVEHASAHCDAGPRRVAQSHLMRRLPLALFATLAACRAAPIPEGERFPAGTQFTARFLQVGDTKVRYIDAGEGTAVIFIHGLG